MSDTIADISLLNQPRYRPQSPTPRVPEDLWRWRAWRPRLLHPRYTGPHFFDDQDSNDLPESIHYYRCKFPVTYFFTFVLTEVTVLQINVKCTNIIEHFRGSEPRRAVCD